MSNDERPEATPISTAGQGLEVLEATLRRDLEMLEYPRPRWVYSRKTSNDANILDVLIVGGGQSGVAIAAALLREKVDNLLVVDRQPRGLEGPWRTFARMDTLRTPGYVTGLEQGIPSLTFQAWYEAQHGEGSMEDLGRIPREAWADYLAWYRDLFDVPVRNQTEAGPIRWNADERCFEIPVFDVDEDGLRSEAVREVLFARKIVLATGIDGCGRWSVPGVVATNLPRHLYAHTRDEIDFSRLRGKRVAVLGGAASAYDNAALALEHGAAEVHLFYRRKKMPRINFYRWAEFVGFLRHHADLPDAERWRFARQLVRMGELPPREAWERARTQPAFHVHEGSPWLSVETVQNEVAVVTTPGAVSHEFDFCIIATGFSTDLTLRGELAEIADQIQLWQDVYTPPEEDAHEELGRHPYLGECMEMTPRDPARHGYIRSIFNYTFGSLVSQGFAGAQILGFRYSLPRLVRGITRQLYVEDSEAYFESLATYSVQDF